MLKIIFGASKTGKTTKAQSIVKDKRARYIVAGSSLTSRKLAKTLADITQNDIVIDNAENLSTGALMVIRYFIEANYKSITLVGHTRLRHAIEKIPPLLRRVSSMKEHGF